MILKHTGHKKIQNLWDNIMIIECEEDYLELLVANDMISEGYDPLNKDDVKKYWTSKGIEVNG